MSLTRVGDDGLGRSLWLAQVENLGEWPEEIPVLGYFVLLLAVDARGVNTDEIFRFARLTIGQGLVYLCVWGHECERVHDIFDGVPEIFDPSDEGSLVQTTWHDDEPLDEALWFALHSAWPAEAYETEFRSIVALSVAQPEWADEIAKALRDPDDFSRRILARDEELEASGQNRGQVLQSLIGTAVTKCKVWLRR